MSDHPFEPSRGDGPGEERAWDEYDWERFLQQQDQKTEKYMELLEKYMDHPDRDAIINREMGWHHLLDENGKDWSEDLDALFSREMAELHEQHPDFDNGCDDENGDTGAHAITPGEGHGSHPVYQLSHALSVAVVRLFGDRDAAVQASPAAGCLIASATLAGAKLAAALGDDDIDELGMTIAYLKRALKAITDALGATLECEHEGVLDEDEARGLKARIFQIRDGIVQLMGEYRGEWRRRHGR